MNESNVGGKLEQLGGKLKEGLGDAFGNEKLANEGAADQVKGNVKEGWGNVKDTASDLGNSATAGTTTNHTPVTSGTPEYPNTTTGESFRDKVTTTAEHAKESLNRGLDHLKGE